MACSIPPNIGVHQCGTGAEEGEGGGGWIEKPIAEWRAEWGPTRLIGTDLQGHSVFCCFIGSSRGLMLNNSLHVTVIGYLL